MSGEGLCSVFVDYKGRTMAGRYSRRSKARLGRTRPLAPAGRRALCDSLPAQAKRPEPSWIAHRLGSSGDRDIS